MTTYFDSAMRAVRQLPKGLEDEPFLRAVAEIEQTVVAHVMLNTGDREFPNDLRDTILGLVVLHGVHYVLNEGSLLQPTKMARYLVLTLRASALITQLHSAFHALAARRIETRFGLWTDSPDENLRDRDRHDIHRAS